MKVPGGSLFLCGFVYFFQLGGIELVVATFFRHKFFMASGLHDAAVINVHDPVAAADRGETVGDDEGGSSLKHGVEAGLQGFFRLDVDAGGGLVEDQDGGIGEQGSRKGDELFGPDSA